ncbi:MAG TPA: hypothetical protein VF581_07950 [Flavobacterium sp.]
MIILAVTFLASIINWIRIDRFKVASYFFSFLISAITVLLLVAAE